MRRTVKKSSELLTKWEYGTIEFNDLSVVAKDSSFNALNNSQILEGINILSNYVSVGKLATMRNVIEKRSDKVRFVFENPGNPNNVFAALRTIDSFGIQNVDVITKASITDRKSMHFSIGSQKWLTLNRYDDSPSCLSQLRSQGFRIFATDVNPASSSIREIPGIVKDDKFAIVMGNEENGISEEVRSLSDGFFHIPMKGFAESFNLSVATGVICTHLEVANKLAPSMSQEDKNLVLLQWMARSVRAGDQLLRRHAILPPVPRTR